MTTRDAAQIAALPKSAVWSRMPSDVVFGGGASRSLTSERTEHTSSPATSGGRPKGLSLARPGSACEEVRETMRKHTQHTSAAGVSHREAFGGGGAVWHDELRGGAADPPHAGLGHAGRAVLVTACDSGRRPRGGRPDGVHLLPPTLDEVRTHMRRHTTHGPVAGASFTGVCGGGRAVWHDELRGGAADPPRTAPRHAGRAVFATACRQGQRRRGGHPIGVHPLWPETTSSPRGGLRTGASGGVHPFRAYELDRRGGLPHGAHPAPGCSAHRPRSTGGSPSGIRHDRPLVHGLGRRGGLPPGIHPFPSGLNGPARLGGRLLGAPLACRPSARQSNQGLIDRGGRPTGARLVRPKP
jgi:hypothetical protein